MSVLTTSSPVLLKLWGIPFVVIGLYLIAGRFFADAWARRNTVYAITNKRVLVARTRPFPKVTAVPLNELGVVNLIEGANGSGTIRFEGARSTFGRRGFSTSWSPAFDPIPQLIGIDQVRTVFALLQQAQQPAAL
ncbi:PH domain-containing protein [Pleomorphomonas sp. PLEO]|uniref:PH domain-containing protein n=1 Tax=Pleomorphomonas sp. PLEO TaxID=3239306 RepID=UPI00351E8DDC